MFASDLKIAVEKFVVSFYTLAVYWLLLPYEA